MDNEENVIKLTLRELKVLQDCIYVYKYLSFPKTYRKMDNKEITLIYLKIRDCLTNALEKQNLLSSDYFSKNEYLLDDKLGNNYKYEEEIEILKRSIEDEDDWISFELNEKIKFIDNYFEPFKYKKETIDIFVRYGDEYHLKNN